MSTTGWFPAGAEVTPILSAEEGVQAPLYFFTAREEYKPADNGECLYFCADKEFKYTAFFADFGPLDIGQTHKFCGLLEVLLCRARDENKSVAVWCSNAANGHARSNTAVLLCAYLTTVLGMSAEMAYKPFLGLKKPLTPFRDAAFALNTWPLFVLDCCRAFKQAGLSNHYSHKNFDEDKYEHLSQLHNGDICWIVPGKLLAFSGPLAKRKELASGKFTMIPEDYITPFKQLGVTTVVRFNNKCYDKRHFEKGGIRHVDMFYEDGGNPTEAILQSFLRLCETQEGGIAVHCKAGLGRTGTNICAFMVKHLGYTVRESIAWHRICRPGAVVGPQQHYLCSIEDKLKMEGAQFKMQAERNSSANRNQAASKSPCGGSSGSSRKKQGSSYVNSASNKLADLSI